MTNRETLAPKAYRLTLAKQLFREIIIYLMTVGDNRLDNIQLNNSRSLVLT